jgi:hypothetical protein
MKPVIADLAANCAERHYNHWHNHRVNGLLGKIDSAHSNFTAHRTGFFGGLLLSDLFRRQVIPGRGRFSNSAINAFISQRDIGRKAKGPQLEFRHRGGVTALQTINGYVTHTLEK